MSLTPSPKLSRFQQSRTGLFFPASVSDMQTNYVVSPVGPQTRVKLGDRSIVGGITYECNGGVSPNQWTPLSALPAGYAAGRISMFDGTAWVPTTLAALSQVSGNQVPWTGGTDNTAGGVNLNGRQDINSVINASAMDALLTGAVGQNIIPLYTKGGGNSFTGAPPAFDGAVLSSHPLSSGFSWSADYVAGNPGRALEIAVPPGANLGLLASDGSRWRRIDNPMVQYTHHTNSSAASHGSVPGTYFEATIPATATYDYSFAIDRGCNTNCDGGQIAVLVNGTQFTGTGDFACCNGIEHFTGSRAFNQGDVIAIHYGGIHYSGGQAIGSITGDMTSRLVTQVVSF